MENTTTECTKELASEIIAINKSTVHKICSGQVVLSLATAVKELVENAIDAGATIIEVKLRDQGIELIEVCDNGSGVEEANFAGLTAKYHTSKLREFSDLTDVSTFGFRGEALSSLCALSNMTITTRHSSAHVGTKLELDNQGCITNRSACPRSIGTTIALANLFSTLPVRKREFHKNIKKEFSKMCQILQAYCLVATGVRIICTNQNKNRVKSTIMATFGSNEIVDNITAIFGPKQKATLLELKSHIESNELNSLEELECEEDEENLQQHFDKFQIRGWISSCSHGSGRASRDRQFIYINSRPCEPKYVLKIVNEMYHRYNPNQSPFVFLNVLVERKDVDVNVTPDKRQLMVNNEKVLLAALKISLQKTFSTIASTYKMQNLQDDVKTAAESSATAANSSDEDDEKKLKPDKQMFASMLSQWRSTGRTDEPCKPLAKRKICDEVAVRNVKMRTIQSFLTQAVELGSRNRALNEHDSSSDDSPEKEEEEQSFCLEDTAVIVKRKMQNIQATTSSSSEMDLLPSTTVTTPTKYEKVITCKVQTPSSEKKLKMQKLPSPLLESNKVRSEEIHQPSFTFDGGNEEEDSNESDVVALQNGGGGDVSSKISITIQQIEELMRITEQHSESKNKIKLERLKFQATIDPSKNAAAEQELQMEITKDKFASMDIVGQFNLGFIIAKSDQDLFIVDQHATDEKYNFETLQATTILQSQQLVRPQPLELTAVNEMILIDNLKIFEMNGFKFEIDEQADPTKRVKLLAKPFSKNWEFGKEDIDELLFMLQEVPNEICRPSRIRSMFASRACRKSVMIGTSLSHSKMKRLINQMGEIDQPWNCPHGRPTMRHLINLAMLDDTK